MTDRELLELAAKAVGYDVRWHDDGRNRSEKMTEKKTVWVAYTNTDCTEGRGHDVPIAVCATEATALRMARKQYVQGSDGPVRTMELVNIDGKWYAPSAAISVIEPTRGDVAAQAALDARREAVAKAKAAGLTDADLQALGLRA